LLTSALNEQGGGASLRLGRGGIPPTPPFRLALALDADGICASVSWRATIYFLPAFSQAINIS